MNSNYEFFARYFGIFFLLLSQLTMAADSSSSTERREGIPFAMASTEVISASKMAQQVSDSPSAVAIITAEDIRTYGYRSIADVLNGMRGLFTTYDRNYHYMGGRGFGKPGDYIGRIMLLIDGYPTQDNLYNQAYIDNSGLIDLDLVDRVEYVPGSGSPIYGNNALLGSINIITKRGSDLDGTQVAAEIFSYGGKKQRVSFGKQFENGVDLLVSASRLRSSGQDLYFPAYDAAPTNYGEAQGIDFEKADRLFGKIKWSDLIVEAAYVKREKAVPTNPLSSTAFNRLYRTLDENAFIQARYETDLSLDLQAVSRLYYGFYSDKALREYANITDDEMYRFNNNQGQWWGVDQKLVANWFRDHTLVFGLEFRQDLRQDFVRKYLSPTGQTVRRVDEKFSRSIYSFYFTDEMRLSQDWVFNLGARYDHASDSHEKNLSPRLALIFTPNYQTTVKFSHSKAFRLPSADEKRFFQELVISETVTADEVVVQHQFSPDIRFLASVYHSIHSGELVYDDALGQYTHGGKRYAKGFELELERIWRDSPYAGMRLRTSFAQQHAHDANDKELVNSPRHIAKLNFSHLLGNSGLRLGWEGQYLGARLSLTEKRLSPVILGNVTVSTERKWYGFAAVLSVKNLANKRYDAVAPFTRTGADGRIYDTLAMDGRSFWLQLTCDF